MAKLHVILSEDRQTATFHLARTNLEAGPRVSSGAGAKVFSVTFNGHIDDVPYRPQEGNSFLFECGSPEREARMARLRAVLEGSA